MADWISVSLVNGENRLSGMQESNKMKLHPETKTDRRAAF